VKLHDLARALNLSLPDGTPDPDVSGVTHNAAWVQPGMAFVAIRGARFDGHSFLADVAARGAVLVLGEGLPDGVASPLPYLRVPEARAALADVAAALHGDPDLLRDLHAALRNPHWPLSLGRKAFVPGTPLWCPDGLQAEGLLDTLRHAPTLRRESDQAEISYRLIVDRREVSDPPRHATPGDRRDDPSAPFSERRYALRDVLQWAEPLPHLHATPEVPA